MTGQQPAEHLERELAVLLRRAHSISVQLSGGLSLDLEPAAYGLMLQVAQRTGTRATDLAAYLGVGKATVARQLTRLEHLNLIMRSDDVLDRRAQVVTLTAAGCRHQDQMRAARQAQVHKMIGGWGDGEVELLAGLLGRFNQALASSTSAGMADVSGQDRDDHLSGR